MSFKICVTKIPQREKKKGRNNIFRDNSSEFSKKKIKQWHLALPIPKGIKKTIQRKIIIKRLRMKDRKFSH